MKKLLVIALLALPSFADSVFVGTVFNGPAPTPTGAYIHALGNGIYSIQSVQVTQVHLKPTITFQTVTTQDFGYDFSTLLPAQIRTRLSLIGLGGAGASASSSALTGAFDGGGVGQIHTKYFDVTLGAKVVKTPQSGVSTVPIAGLTFRWQ